ncbi:Leu/Phe/Val dehydrogenase [Sphingomonas ursincola]|uniref:Leu/Phe/Val dehydrogenase n=1 Tax=Sphingomonas ursincola TaxID=56361 RepID=UPI0023523271|nr:Glu/Leu/Phe/Val dehydrogenase dimerization domain-containing protein [Sphingomonas ursincola]MBY0619104.1 NAD(P)-binding domain-containing protein [Sphingomonas ursincola]
MQSYWDLPDFDEHEAVQYVHDRASGLSAIIAIHSTALGPAGGGTRFWHYADKGRAITDALRLSRGMSYKNAMAGLPMGGGKAVILADADNRKTPEMLAAFGDAIDALGGRYVTAEDIGMSDADMVAISKRTKFVSGLPVQDAGSAGGDPGPFTAKGIFLGVKAAVAFKLGTDRLKDVRIAVQGTGSVGGGLARLLAAEGAKLTLADVNADRAQKLADELGAETVSADRIMQVEADVFSPNALGAILDSESIEKLNVAIVAGGANNQLARPHHGDMLIDRAILYAPDYVINAGGIISVALEYFAQAEGRAAQVEEVHARLTGIPQRLTGIWQESRTTGESPATVADRMAQKLIGRG